MSSILRRPSLAVAAWAALVLGLFALRGDLGIVLRAKGQATAGNVVVRDPEPVVVRRRDAAVRLPRAIRSGRVVDSMGYLLVGAEVVPEVGDPVRTDSEGRFTVELVAARTNDLLVRAEGRQKKWLRTTAIGPDPLAITLPPSAPWDGAPSPPPSAPHLRGEGLVHGPDGRPLANAFVNAVGSDCWGRTDDIGRYELPLPSASVTFAVFQAGGANNVGGFAARSRPFVAPRPRGIVPLPDLMAEAGHAIRGTLRDAHGAPVAGVPVEVRGGGVRRLVETGSGGAFAVEGLVSGPYVVEPFAHRGAVGKPVAVQIARESLACDLQLQTVAEAVLRVVDEAGAAAAEVWVASSLFGRRRGVAQADTAGMVRVPFSSASEFDVRAGDNYARCVVRSFDAAADPATLVIAQP